MHAYAYMEFDSGYMRSLSQKHSTLNNKEYTKYIKKLNIYKNKNHKNKDY